MSEVAPALEDILLAALFAAERPLPIDEIANVFELGDNVPKPSNQDLEEALERARARIGDLPLEIRKLAGGYRLEVPKQYSAWVSRLWVERPARYSRALLETLALIAYRQPITRPEIESVRGVAVNTNIIRTLTERGWIRIVGHRDAPGRPALYGTTRVFLDYFGLASLEELPTLAEIRELSDYEPELPLEEEGEIAAAILDEGEASAEAEENGDGGAPPAEVVAGPWARADGETGEVPVDDDGDDEQERPESNSFPDDGEDDDERDG